MDKLRIAFTGLLLLLLLTLGVPLEAVAFLGLLFAAIILLKDRLWKRIDRFLDSQKIVPKEPKWLRGIIVFAAFLVAYYVVKFVIFYILAAAGFDVQAELIKSMNVTQ
ncbi:MAG: hypothetical protein WCX64_03160 [Candidatus Micrarchaeia archaeon]|jgi:hypothetical protein